MKTGNTNYIYKNDLDKACFQHDIAYGGYKDVTKRTESDKVSKDKAFKKQFLFSIGVFFPDHSRITGLQGKGESIYSTPHYHFHPLHRHLDINQAITAESSPLHTGSSQTRTENLWFASAIR